ncbi:MAG: ChuX/HutX family heme-like substrate-binding protein [Burkholderiaceae bacterium]
MNAADIRSAFAQARSKGMRAREAAISIGQSEGAVVAAHAGHHERGLRSVPLKADWLALLQSLRVCGPLMGLTRNDSTVIEKTGVYENLSAQGHVGLALGRDIDLRLFFHRWHAGFSVTERQANGTDQTSLQFYDAHGAAVHKIYPRAHTNLPAWEKLHRDWVDPQQTPVFQSSQPAQPQRAPDTAARARASEFAQAWSALTDTHQFFGLLRQFGLERQQAFALVEGRFTQRVHPEAASQLLMAAALDATPIMVFVGSPACIQIHTGPVGRVEPMQMQGVRWLNVLDPGFNLHLREDRIASAWIVEKPGDAGTVTSLELFDTEGGLMAMFFGARKPGGPERADWRALVMPLRETVSQAVSA